VIEIITMGSSMKLFTFTFVLLALIELGFGGICRNPGAYQGDVVSDPWGGYRGECVSFYKVNIFVYLFVICSSPTKKHIY
jgi:hypothetical protein